MNRLINKVIAVVSAASVALTGVNFGALDLSAWAENLEDVTITLSDGNGELFSAADSADEKVENTARAQYGNMMPITGYSLSAARERSATIQTRQTHRGIR